MAAAPRVAISKFQAAKHGPFKLQAEIPFEEYSTVRVVYTHEATAATAHVAAVMETRKEDLPFAPDPSDKERVIRVLYEFTDACGDARLHIHNADRYTALRKVIGGTLKSSWDTIVQEIPDAEKVDARWGGHLRLLTRTFCPSNSFQALDEYLRQATKPFNMDCYTVAARIQLLSRLSQYLPGSSGAQLYTEGLQMKNAFFRVMLPDWQIRFTETGRTLDDNTYTLQHLVDFMEQRRIFHDAQKPKRPRYEGNNYYQGNGYYGPRGGGRGHYSGYNRGNQGYQGYQGYQNNFPARGGGRHYHQTPHRQQQRPSPGGRGYSSPSYRTPPGGRGGFQGRGSPGGRTPGRFGGRTTGRGGRYGGRQPNRQLAFMTEPGRGPGVRQPYAPPSSSHNDHYYEESASGDTNAVGYSDNMEPNFQDGGQYEDHYYQEDPSTGQGYNDSGDYYDPSYEEGNDDGYRVDDWVQDY